MGGLRLDGEGEIRMELGQMLAAVGGWTNVGAGALLVLVVVAILRGLLIPRGLVAREDAARAVDEIRNQTAARVADAHARIAEHMERARQAEIREDRWREAWMVSESGRRLAAEQAAGVVAATAPVTQVLTSKQATTGLGLTSPDQ